MSFLDDAARELYHDWLNEQEPVDRPTAADLASDLPVRPSSETVADVERAIRARLAHDADMIRRGLA